MNSLLSLILIFCFALPSLAAEPRRARGASGPAKCVHEPENSQAGIKSLTGGKSLSDWAFGNEEECLEKNGLMTDGKISDGARISGRDLNSYFSSCEFVKKNEYSEIGKLTTALSLQNRDALVNGMWQQLAHRSHAQLVCRQNTINQYFKNPDKRTQLNGKAKAQFKDGLKDIRKLLALQKESASRAKADIHKRIDCSGVAAIMCNQMVAQKTEQDEDDYSAAIGAKISEIPFGYEPNMNEALMQMVVKGDFDELAYANAMAQAQKSYRDLDSYWDDKITHGQGGDRFCIKREFKESAAAGLWSTTDQLLEQANTDKLGSTQRTVVQCYIRSRYKEVPDNKEEALHTGAMLAAGTGAVLSSVVTGGSAAAAYVTAGSLLVNTGLMAAQAKKTYEVCTAKNFVVSANPAESCDAEKNFDREASLNSTKSCGTEVVMSLLSATGMGLEGRALAKALRPISQMAQEAGSAAKAASAAGDAAEAENEIVVTGVRTSKRSKAANTGSRAAATGRKNSELAAQSQATLSEDAKEVLAAARANMSGSSKIVHGSEAQKQLLARADKLGIEERQAIAQALRPNKPLTQIQKDAIEEAHNIPLDQPGLKGMKLRRAGFSQKEVESLMRSGVTGEGFADGAATAARASVKTYKTVDDAEAAVYNATNSGNKLMSEAKLATNPEKAKQLRAIAAESYTHAADASLAAGRMHKGLEAREAFKEADRLYRQAKNLDGSANAVVERLAIAGKPELGFAEIRTAAKEAADAARANPSDVAAAAKAKFFKDRVELVEAKWRARGNQVPDGAEPAANASARTVATSNPSAASQPTRQQILDQGNKLRLSGNSEQASGFYLKAAEKPSFADRNYAIAFDESVKGTGETARQMAVQASKANGERLENFVDALSKKSQTNLSEVEKQNLLGTVQELRKLPPRELQIHDTGSLRKIEERLLSADQNPAGQVFRASHVRGTSDSALNVYKSRLQNGWSRESIVSDIQYHRQIAEGMVRNVSRTGDASAWQRQVEMYDRILRDLPKP